MWEYCMREYCITPATPHGSAGTAVPGARHGMYLYTSEADPACAPRLMERVRGSLFVGVPGLSQALQFGRLLIVPLPVHGQPIVQPERKCM